MISLQLWDESISKTFLVNLLQHHIAPLHLICSVCQFESPDWHECKAASGKSMFISSDLYLLLCVFTWLQFWSGQTFYFIYLFLVQSHSCHSSAHGSPTVSSRDQSVTGESGWRYNDLSITDPHPFTIVEIGLQLPSMGGDERGGKYIALVTYCSIGTSAESWSWGQPLLKSSNHISLNANQENYGFIAVLYDLWKKSI